MAIDTVAAFARIQQALEDFNTEVLKVRSAQEQSEEAVASVEYELDQLRKLIADNALETFQTKLTQPSNAAEAAILPLRKIAS